MANKTNAARKAKLNRERAAARRAAAKVFVQAVTAYREKGSVANFRLVMDAAAKNAALGLPFSFA